MKIKTLPLNRKVIRMRIDEFYGGNFITFNMAVSFPRFMAQDLAFTYLVDYVQEK